jgi:hypothetical protein
VYSAPVGPYSLSQSLSQAHSLPTLLLSFPTPVTDLPDPLPTGPAGGSYERELNNYAVPDSEPCSVGFAVS